MDVETVLLGTIRDAALGLDVSAFERARAEAEGRIPPGWSAWASLFSRFIAGDLDAVGRGAEALERASAANADAVLVIEAAALRALALIELGDLEQARSVARRASRMARTEAFPEQEHVANLVLARVRRLTGHPHLAARILTSLASVVSPRFRPWTAWELAMAGADTASAVALDELGPSPARDAARALLAFFDAAERGAHDEMDASVEALGMLSRHPCFGSDVAALRDATDLAVSPSHEAVASWCRGATADSPPALHGVLTRRGSAPRDEPAIAYVASHAPSGPRRIPRIVWAHAAREGVLALPQGRKKQGRNESVLAALTLAGPEGLAEDALFAEVYGFAFVSEMHRGVLGVCLHRAREYLGAAGAIDNAKGRLTLTLATPILVPDPRCANPMEDRLLRAVAEQRGATAKDIAATVGISLRVAQDKLAELSADGSCIAHREGREVRYEVEDTTFSEPTAHR